MSGLVFRSLADVPAGMRDQAAQKLLEDARERQKTVPVAEDSGKESKYHNEQTEVAGLRFDSKKEARRYEQLMIMLSLGQIRDLRLQQDFTLQEAYTTPEGERPDRRRGRDEGRERVAAVGKAQAHFDGHSGCRAPQQDSASVPSGTGRISFTRCAPPVRGSLRTPRESAPMYI